MVSKPFEKSKKEGGSQDFIAKIRGIVHIGGGVYRIVSYIKKKCVTLLCSLLNMK